MCIPPSRIVSAQRPISQTFVVSVDVYAAKPDRLFVMAAK